jgi:hypothetical protein
MTGVFCCTLSPAIGDSVQLFLQSNPALILRPPAPIVGGDEEEI